MQTHARINAFISCLSFDEYVLVDCLKFSILKEDRYLCHSRFNNFDFVALTKQGFYNAFKEIRIMLTGASVELQLFNNQFVFLSMGTVFTIKYFEKVRLDEVQLDEKKLNYKTEIDSKTNKMLDCIKDLINLPGLDFCKCCYDGTKIHCTPEAIQCHKLTKYSTQGKYTWFRL
jgi:hypothetical protein